MTFHFCCHNLRYPSLVPRLSTTKRLHFGYKVESGYEYEISIIPFRTAMSSKNNKYC